MKRPAVFLDRDGTILTERGYLADPAKIFFYPTVFSALKRLKKAGFRLIVVTNQSGVARGYLSLSTLKRINAVFTRTLAHEGVRIDGIYFCPHHPEKGCPCRKPSAYLAKKAARDLKINLKGSFVIGDQGTDIGMAQNLGIPGVMVLTGAGRSLRKKVGPQASKVTSNLSTAVDWILSRV